MSVPSRLTPLMSSMPRRTADTVPMLTRAPARSFCSGLDRWNKKLVEALQDNFGRRLVSPSKPLERPSTSVARCESLHASRPNPLSYKSECPAPAVPSADSPAADRSFVAEI